MRAIFANDKVDLDGDRFSPELLRKMAEQETPVPLLLEFNPEAILGIVRDFVYDERTKEFLVR